MDHSGFILVRLGLARSAHHGNRETPPTGTRSTTPRLMRVVPVNRSGVGWGVVSPLLESFWAPRLPPGRGFTGPGCFREGARRPRRPQVGVAGAPHGGSPGVRNWPDEDDRCVRNRYIPDDLAPGSTLGRRGWNWEQDQLREECPGLTKVRWDAPGHAPGLIRLFVAGWSLDWDALADEAGRTGRDPAGHGRTGRSPALRAEGSGPEGPLGAPTTRPPFPDSRRPAVVAKRVKVERR